VYSTSVATHGDRREILKFLERRLAHNAWVIQGVHDALQDPQDFWSVVVCRRRGKVIGAAHVMRVVASQTGYAYAAQMDGARPQAVEVMTEALPAGEVGQFRLFTRPTQRYFDGLPGAERSEGDLFFTVSAQRFRPVAGEEVVEIAEPRSDLFERCEQQPVWANFDHGGRLFCIVVGGRAVSSAWSSALTPKGPTERRVRTIGALYTETPYRCKGFGRRLVSHMTERILNGGDVPIYWTEPENIASQRLCKSLGFRQYAQEVRYLWCRPGNTSSG